MVNQLKEVSPEEIKMVYNEDQIIWYQAKNKPKKELKIGDSYFVIYQGDAAWCKIVAIDKRYIYYQWPNDNTWAKGSRIGRISKYN